MNEWDRLQMMGYPSYPSQYQYEIQKRDYERMQAKMQYELDLMQMQSHPFPSAHPANTSMQKQNLKLLLL